MNIPLQNQVMAVHSYTLIKLSKIKEGPEYISQGNDRINFR